MPSDVSPPTRIKRLALFFGCWERHQLGHCLYRPNNESISRRDCPSLPWSEGLMDTGLLRNGKHQDIIDGKVFWICGGRDINCLWHAFVWWDRSGDQRPNSNSGFYTYGFPHNQFAEAFAFACSQFPTIVNRQRVPLKLHP
jgi:hypothetical protein